MAAPFAGALTPQVITFTPPSATQVTRGMSPDWVNPRTHEGDVTVERQLPGGISASVAYVVSRGVHLPIFLDANLAPSTTTKTYDILNSSSATAQTYGVPFYTTRINTNTGEVFSGYSDVNSWYNSMVLTLRRPMRHGLDFTANYTSASRATARRCRARPAPSTAPIIPSTPTTESGVRAFGSGPTPALRGQRGVDAECAG